MLSQYRRRTLGLGLVVLGAMLWAAAAALHLAAPVPGGVSIPHMEGRSLAIIAGGAAVAGGIVLIATAA
jgi:hypothetical protein